MITLKEIREQPEKIKSAAEKYHDLVNRAKSYIECNDFGKMVFVGCGTSYYLSMGLAYHLKRISSGEVEADFYSGSEVMLGMRKIDSGTLVVGVSRSGESSETVRALETCRKRGISTLALTCEPGCSMIKAADTSIILDFIEEESIVMTKSFTAMAFVMSALFRDLYRADALPDYLAKIPGLAASVLESTESVYDGLDFGRYRRFALLGYDEYLAACMEGLIKITETSLSEVDGFQTLEYRHGPKSKVDAETFLTILPSVDIRDEESKVAHEMREMGGFVLSVSEGGFEGDANIAVDYEKNDYGDWMLRVIPLQLLGVRKAVSKGLNPDKPQNLTKVVKF